MHQHTFVFLICDPQNTAVTFLQSAEAILIGFENAEIFRSEI